MAARGRTEQGRLGYGSNPLYPTSQDMGSQWAAHSYSDSCRRAAASRSAPQRSRTESQQYGKVMNRTCFQSDSALRSSSKRGIDVRFDPSIQYPVCKRLYVLARSICRSVPCVVTTNTVEYRDSPATTRCCKKQGSTGPGCMAGYLSAARQERLPRGTSSHQPPRPAPLLSDGPVPRLPHRAI